MEYQNHRELSNVAKIYARAIRGLVDWCGATEGWDKKVPGLFFQAED
jgi:hypothetical protein